MKKEITYCDKCGKETKSPTIYLKTDRRMDAAGDMDDEYETIDLCGDCCHDEIKKLIGKLNCTEGKNWLVEARKK